MTRRVVRRASALALAWLGLAAAAGAGEAPIDLAKVPGKARAAADKAVPGATWTAATRHDDGGEVSYELEGQDAKKRDVWVTVAADGTVEDVQTEVAFADLPEAARKGIAAAVPGFTPDEVYEVRDGTDVYYELSGQDRRKRDVWLSVYPDGKVDEVSTAVTMKEVPAAVVNAVKAKFPKFQASAGYEVRLDGKVVRYDIEGRRPRDKDDITLSVTPDGKEVTVDE